MKILVENGCYHLRNMGDVAMLQVTVTRLSKLWPEALIEVITDDPDLLATYCPQAQPIAARGRRLWFNERNLLGGRLPDPLARYWLKLERQLRHHWPGLVHSLIQSRAKRRGGAIDDVNTFLKAVFGADLVVVSGGGDVNDTFMAYDSTILDVVEMAICQGTPTAMFGQGIGPLQKPKPRARAQAVLPWLDLLTIREGRAGPSLLDALGVPPERVITTGDDAIELAYEQRAPELGTGIGVNLRSAAYSEVSSANIIETLRTVLNEAAKKYGAVLVPVPISFHESESDVRTIQVLLAGHDNGSDGGQALDTPLKVIEQARRCRVVITGSYHSAVFALSQGIPVVSLARSAYYTDKFLGLADQFGTGCEVVLLDDEQLRDKLMAAIDRAWQSAEQVRPQLLAAAARQIEKGHAAYRRVFELVAAKENA